MTGTLALNARRACDEIAGVFDAVDPDNLTAVMEAIATARRVACYGVGREGLMIRALTMRLYHLGLETAVVGDMTAPPIARGDLLLVSAGPGHFATVSALMTVARDAGARVVLLTAQPRAALGGHADIVLQLPARTMAGGGNDGAILPMGSAYEGALFIVGELLVRQLRERLGTEEGGMRARHTNLE